MKLVLHEDSVLTGVHFSGIQDRLRMTLGIQPACGEGLAEPPRAATGSTGQLLQ